MIIIELYHHTLAGTYRTLPYALGSIKLETTTLPAYSIDSSAKSQVHITLHVFTLHMFAAS